MFESLSSKGNTFFIYQLYKLIQEENSIISWIDSGKSFLIHSQIQFQEKILSKYFFMKKFVSFTRKLTKYGFSRSKKSPHAFVFHHRHFTSEGSELDRIQKLTKSELMPKHLKLKMLREEYSQKLTNEKEQQECQEEKEIETVQQQKIAFNEVQQRQNLYQNLLMELLLGDE